MVIILVFLTEMVKVVWILVTTNLPPKTLIVVLMVVVLWRQGIGIIILIHDSFIQRELILFIKLYEGVLLWY